MKASAPSFRSSKPPMIRGTMAPPEMAMHIRPLSSLARSGLSSTVIENSIGQMLAKPRPAATTPASASGLEPVIKAAAPSRPSKAESRKQVRGDMTVSTALPSSRPMVSNRKKTAGPEIAGRVLVHPEALEGRLQEPAHRRLGAHVKEDPHHRQEEDRLAEQARLEPMLGGTSALVSSTFKDSTATKARAMSTQNSGKAPRQPMLLKKASELMAQHQVGGGRAADPLDALGQRQVPAVAALGAHVAHDRVAGHLEERGPHAQQEDAPEQHRKRGYHERRDHQRQRVEPQAQQQQLLLADPGRQQAARHAEHGERDEHRERQQRRLPVAQLVGVLDGSALGPMASAKPMRKKARKIGSVLNRIGEPLGSWVTIPLDRDKKLCCADRPPAPERLADAIQYTPDLPGLLPHGPGRRHGAQCRTR